MLTSVSALNRFSVSAFKHVEGSIRDLRCGAKGTRHVVEVQVEPRHSEAGLYSTEPRSNILKPQACIASENGRHVGVATCLRICMHVRFPPPLAIIVSPRGSSLEFSYACPLSFAR